MPFRSAPKAIIPEESIPMNDDQIERLEEHRKLPAKGKFLAGAATYDEHGHMLPTGTVPVADPRAHPAEGDIVEDVAEQGAEAPDAPVTPDPYGGTVSTSHAAPTLPDANAEEQAKHREPGR